jgi:hypothetical protein
MQIAIALPLKYNMVRRCHAPEYNPLSLKYNMVRIRTILILTANPNDTQSLRTDKEIQKIQNSLRQPKLKNQFDIIFECAQPESLLDLIEDYRPEIVHFCGHGTQEGLVLESTDSSHLVSTEALEDLFEQVKGYVRCVLLNACHSRIHAEAISKHIPHTIGMDGEILDRSAIAFALKEDWFGSPPEWGVGGRV